MVGHVSNHKELAEQDLLSVYHKPRVRALVAALAEAVQISEERAFGTLVGVSLPLSQGVWLDFWGALAGEARGALGDDDYRKIITARIFAAYSTSAVDDMITAFEIVTAPSRVRHWNHPPRAFSLTAWRLDPLSDTMRERVKFFMESMKPGGVNMRLVEAVEGESLQYDDGPGYDVGAYARLI